MSVLNKTVSYFQSKNATTQGVDTNLLTILQSGMHKDSILRLRASDTQTQKELKENLPCFTVTGTFSRRCEEGIIERSGLAPVDLDSAEDYDKVHLLNELKKISSIAYAGLSCRGNRLWAIVPFLNPDKYEKHYERLIQSFQDMGLPIGDNCHKQISQPRFVSWNENNTQFFNHNARLYDLLPPIKTFHNISRPPKHHTIVDNPAGAFAWCNEQINKSHIFQEKSRHNYILALARYCNLKGISEQETLDGCLGYVQSDFTEAEITKIVKHVYTTQTDSFNKIPYIEKKSPVEMPSIVKPQEKKAEKHLIETSFLGLDGKFYIPNPVQPNQIAVYTSPDAYNKRLHLPEYIDKIQAEMLFKKQLQIDPETLLIISE